MLLRSRPAPFAFALSSGVLFPGVLALVVAACGSDANEAPPAGGGGGSGSPGPGIDAGFAALPDARASTEDEGPPPPIVRRDFPLEVPELGGYGLAEYFPDTMKLTIPAAVAWPTAPGAVPLVLERMGSVVRMENGLRRSLLDFTGEVALEGEGGALGMALHPQFGDGSGPRPYAYFWYNAKGSPRNVQRLARYTWSVASQSFDPASRLVMIEEEEQHTEHNAGRVAFGKDGFLYFGNGDDLDASNHQTLGRALFAGIFRIDVDSDPARSHAIPRPPAGGFSTGYMIPNDNPFVGQGGLEEFYALGFRNPFMFSFDRETNDLWVGDVGDSFREEIDKVERGGNYQWPVREGELVRAPGGALTIGAGRDPIFAYSHHEMGDLSAIFGGFVYRGRAMPELVGKYVYSDWPSARIWALDPGRAGGGPTKATLVASQWERVPMAMTEDNDGEIYLVHYRGIARLVRDPAPQDVPRRLVETKIFEDLGTMKVADGFLPYRINSPLWSDGATKQRWISVPPGEKVTVAKDGSLVFPVGTRFVKQFDLPEGVKPRNRSRHLETRVLVVGRTTTYGLSYRWNAEGTDASLAPEGFDEAIVDEATGVARTWHTPSFGQCWSCHRADNRVLGFTRRQIELEGQPRAFADKGLFDPSLLAAWPAALPSPGDAARSIEERALAYLAANCSSCHHEGASYTGGDQTWIASPDVPLAARGLVGAPNHNYPVASALGLTQGNAPLVKPGDPKGSLLVRRLETQDHDLMMPPLGKNVVDAEGAKLISDWVASMPAAD